MVGGSPALRKGPRRPVRRRATRRDINARLTFPPSVATFTKGLEFNSFGDLSNYTSDFMVRTNDRKIWIVETKGRTELDVPRKMARLRQWCVDATAVEEDGQVYDYVFVDQIGFERHEPKTFAALVASFTEYKS